MKAVIEMKGMNARIMLVKLLEGKMDFVVICEYALQDGLSRNVKGQFWGRFNDGDRIGTER